MPFSLLAAVYLIACHGGPADHFAAFTEYLTQEGIKVEIFASGVALKKFKDRGIEVQHPFSAEQTSLEEEEDILAEQIAKMCSSAQVVITDVGHRFAVQLQKALSFYAPHIPRLAYYDNPEPYVPGGYSEFATEAMLATQGILFANTHLVTAPLFQEPGKEIDFGSRKKIGIGYYPFQQAEKIIQQRKTEHVRMREQFFLENNLEDMGQKLLVYFGGNNTEYFDKAFPAFLSLLEESIKQSDLSNFVFVIQQHPGAKHQNLDGNSLTAWIKQQPETQNSPKTILSHFSSEIAQVIADAALYFQTSMGPQFVLAGIPTAQIGHATFYDVLVSHQLCPSVTHVDHFVQVINNLTDQKQEIPREIIFDKLGIKENWQNLFAEAIAVICHP